MRDNNQGLKIVLFATVFVFSFKFAFAYDDKTTHPALTDEIVDFYNLSFPDKQLTVQQKEWIIEGSVWEDTAPRWINHFYDPVSKEGWSGEHAGAYDKETVRLVSEKVIAPFGITPVSSLNWLHDESLQAKYAFYKGVKTWERGLLEMIKDDEKGGYRILGHVLHLLEDLSVPEHTRNDTHAHELEEVTGDFGSPYEEYLKNYTRENIKKELDIAENLKRENLAPVGKATIDEYLISLAEYSNKYFFSKDTIDDEKYQYPKIVRDDGNFGYGVDENKKEFPLVLLNKVWNKEKLTYDFNYLLEKPEPAYYPILDAYFSRLSRKAVLHGAGVIDLFRREVEFKKEYSPHLVTYDFSPFNYFRAPGFSFSGELYRFKNAVQSFFTQAASAVGGAFSSVGDFFGGVFENDSNFRLAATIALDNKPSPSQASGNQSSFPESSVNQNRNGSNSDFADSTGADVSQNQFVQPAASVESGQEGPPQDQTPALPENSPASSPVFRQCAFNTSFQPLRQKVLINELAWMGTTDGANNEWVELKNISGGETDLGGWQIIDKSEQIKVAFEIGEKIPAGGFYLLERTDDGSAPAVVADKIYAGALSNSDEGIRLFDDQCRLMDEVFASPVWPAGDGGSKKTMERGADGLSWQDSAAAGGTPKAENSRPAATYATGGSSGGSAAPKNPEIFGNNSQQQSGSQGTGGAQAGGNQTSAAQAAGFRILISEIQIAGQTASDEFIELYNSGGAPADLTGWSIKRKSSSGAEYSLLSSSRLDGKSVPAGGYFLAANEEGYAGSATPDVNWAKSNTVAASNTVILYDAAQNVIDKAGFGTAADFEAAPAENPAAGQSIQRKIQNGGFVDTDNNTGDFELQICPSPKAQSSGCQAAVNEAPGAFFDFAPFAPTVNEEIVFNAASSTDSDGRIVSYEWDFGDGRISSSTAATTTYSYAVAGSYSIRLAVFDDRNASSTATSTISVAEPSRASSTLLAEFTSGAEGYDALQRHPDTLNGQSITIPGDSGKATIEKIAFLMFIPLTYLPPDPSVQKTYRVNIYNSSSSSPYGDPLATSTSVILSNASHPDYREVEFNFPALPELDRGRQYWFVLRGEEVFGQNARVHIFCGGPGYRGIPGIPDTPNYDGGQHDFMGMAYWESPVPEPPRRGGTTCGAHLDTSLNDMWFKLYGW